MRRLILIIGWFAAYLYADNSAAQTTSRGEFTEIHQATPHKLPVRSIAVSADGQYLATVGDDKMCHILDATTLSLVRSYGPHQAKLNDVVFLRNKTVIVSGMRDENRKASVFFWGWQEQKIIRQLEDSDHDSYSLEISEDESQLCVTLGNESLRLYRLDPFERVGITPPPTTSNALCHCAVFLPSSRFLYFGRGGGFCAFRTDAGNPGLLATVKGDRRIVMNEIACSPSGKHCLTAHADRGVRLWDANTVGQIAFLRGHLSPINCVQFSPNGKFAASGSTDGVIMIWDLPNLKKMRKVVGHTDPVTRVAFSPNGQHLISSSADGTVRLWSLPMEFAEGVPAPGREWSNATGQFRVFANLAGLKNGIARLRKPNGSMLGVPLDRLSADDQEQAKVLASNNPDEPALTIRVSRRIDCKQGPVLSLAFTPDGSQLLTGGNEPVVRLWNAKTGELVREFRGHEQAIGCVAISSDGRRFVTGSWDVTARLWDTETGEHLAVLRDHEYPVLGVAISADGRRALSVSDGIRHWDLDRKEVIGRLDGHTKTVWTVAYSPDGRRALSGSWDETVRLWDLETGKQLQQFAGHQGRVKCVRFSSDGQMAVSAATGGNEVRCWNLQDGKQLHKVVGHRYGVACVAYSPDDRLIVSGGGEMTSKGSYNPDTIDTSICIWGAKTGRLLTELKAHKNYVAGLAFSQDGRYFASCSGDGSAIIWAVSY